MADLIWAIACQRVLTDKETNSVTYVEAVEEFSVPRLPFPFFPVTVGTLWRREKAGENLVTRFSVRSPGGEKLIDVEPKVSDNTSLRHRVNVVLGGFQMQETGRYEFVIEQKSGKKWKEMGRLPIEVTTKG